MAWNNKENVVKKNKRCHNRATQKYCFYWRAKRSRLNNKVIGFRCALFDEDKEGYASLSECDTVYGGTYDGRVIS